MAEARRLLEAAAEQGHRLSQYQLGSMFDHGRSVEQSDELAFAFFEKAAEQGDEMAQCKEGSFC